MAKSNTTVTNNALTANVGTAVKAPKPRKAKDQGQKSQAPEFKLDTDRIAIIGTQVGTLANGAAKAGDTAFDTVRTHIVDALVGGGYETAGEAHKALFTAAYAVKGAKAQWLRTYKSVFNSAIELRIPFDHSTGLSALQKLIKAAKAPGTAEDALKMAIGGAKTAFRRGMTEKAILAAIKAALAEVEAEDEGEEEGEEE